MEYISHDDNNRGQWDYPFLSNLDKWGIVSSDLDEITSINGRKPVFRYVKDDSVKDVYIPGDDHDEFMEATGLTVDMDKGGFVLSKRFSRIMRPYLVYGFVSGVNVLRLTPDQFRDKVWDGAGVISRAFLRQIWDQRKSSITDERVYKRTQWEIETCGRVEFTYMSEIGQEKGHAIVSDTLTAYDLIVPEDVKTQIKFDGEFIGINFVHGSADMRLDIQSLVNLHPFFSVDQLATWLNEEGELFINRVASGEIEDLSRKIDGLSSDSITDWFVMKYFASQGKTKYFSNIVRSIFGQHIKRLNNTTLGGMRLPIHGGRYYIMPDAVGQAAGLNIEVEAGKCVVDKHNATMWVNENDYVDYVADVAGGADNDDAFWMFPFTDTDGINKFLAWRSPNQLGEYILFEAQDNSDLIEWKTVSGNVEWATGDSSLLPTRIDQQTRKYLDLVGESADLGQGRVYSIASMNATIDQAKANAGTLGFYCNMMLVSVALFGKLPDELPAPLEDVIDSSVKTGDDVSLVKEWCEAYRDSNKDQPIAWCIKNRLHNDAPEDPDSWLTELTTIVESHIDYIVEASNSLASQCQPPKSVMIAGREHVEHGSKLMAEYSRAFRDNHESENRLYDAEQNVLGYLASVERPIDAILGTIYHIYTGRNAKPSDTAIFCGQEIGELTLIALRSVGALADIVSDEQGRLVADNFIEPVPAGRVKVNGVWFNAINASGRGYASMSDIPKALARTYKNNISTWSSQGSLDGRVMTVSELGDRQVIYSNGKLLGFVDKAHFIDEDTIEVLCTGADDGNMVLVYG